MCLGVYFFFLCVFRHVRLGVYAYFFIFQLGFMGIDDDDEDGNKMENARYDSLSPCTCSALSFGNYTVIWPVFSHCTNRIEKKRVIESERRREKNRCHCLEWKLQFLVIVW